MYYSDLTPYCYFENTSAEDVLNIGWLDILHPFPRKKAAAALLNAFFEECLSPVSQTRGIHQCELCEDRNTGATKVSRHGRETWLGSAEIRVQGKDGKVYAAPNLIYHYVAVHDYDPPPEFLEALMGE